MPRTLQGSWHRICARGHLRPERSGYLCMRDDVTTNDQKSFAETLPDAADKPAPATAIICFEFDKSCRRVFMSLDGMVRVRN